MARKRVVAAKRRQVSASDRARCSQCGKPLDCTRHVGHCRACGSDPKRRL